MSLDWKNITFGSKFLEKLFLCINAKCSSSFVPSFLLLLLLFLSLLLMKMLSRKSLAGVFLHKETTTLLSFFFFLIKFFALLSHHKFWCFYSAWGFKSFLMLNKLAIRYIAFRLRRGLRNTPMQSRSKAQHCFQGALERGCVQLERWERFLLSLFTTLYLFLMPKKIFQDCCSCFPSAQRAVALGRPLLQLTSSNSKALKYLNGVQLKSVLKCP